MLTVFIICFVVGIVGLLGTFTVGEFSDIGSGHDLAGHDFSGHGEGLPFLSLTTLATALFGFGAGGWSASALTTSDVVSAVVGAAVAAALVLATRGLLIPYMLRQQDNSHIGRTSYIGLLGTVTLPVDADGWGEVSFADPEGNRVGARAISSQGTPLARGITVYIADVDDTYLHVVPVDDAIRGLDTC